MSSEADKSGSSEKFICGTSLSIDEVQNVVNKKLGTNAEITEWTAVEIGAGKGW